MPSPSVLGLDIGGANLKAAHSQGAASFFPFELWKAPGDLPDVLRDLLKSMPQSDLLAITMTGELCDCFETKRQGVRAILDAVAIAAEGVSIRVWTTTGSFMGIAEAKSKYLQAAAANWLALATFAGRLAPRGAALLIDIGSTTTDIVPLLDGRPVSRGRTDTERLGWQELVYTGVRRTPVCSLLGGEGAAELFATMLDVYLLLGDLPGNPQDRRTADGRPATVEAAHARLARMIGGDAETCSRQEILDLARKVYRRQFALLQEAVSGVSSTQASHPATIITSGSGEFLARRLANGTPTISLSEKLGPAISEAACAYAVAVLAAESQNPFSKT
jgi:(4-(4-[2-(gamma-L-glutamylamino)ethyl]phenoxymethyl)furan-2-yl)methanamine synthase